MKSITRNSKLREMKHDYASREELVEDLREKSAYQTGIVKEILDVIVDLTEIGE